MFPVAAAYCAVSAPTGSGLAVAPCPVPGSWVLLVPPGPAWSRPPCVSVSHVHKPPASASTGKAGPGWREKAALGGQAAEADIAEWSPAWPEE